MTVEKNNRDTAKVLFVCLGNICRSPTAHGVFLAKLQQHGLTDHIEVDSAGTSDWHIGGAPDSRSAAAALALGYDLSKLRARQVQIQDFYEFDYILAMDNSNLHDLKTLQPEDGSAHVGLFLAYARDTTLEEVPDPYYSGAEGFTQVLGLVEDASEGLLEQVCRDINIDYARSN